MALLAKRALSPREIAARRANAQKSTGPRTAQGKRRVALNNLRHGMYARSLYDNMLRLGEEPTEFVRLFTGLVCDHRPVGMTEMMLVEDLATLEWQRRRLDRAEAGLLVQQMEKVELERRKRAREIESMSFGGSEAETLETGLRRAPDSPGKFEELMAHVGILSERAKQGDFSDPCREFFEAMYGKNPTWRGSEIARAFRYFVQRPQSEGQEEGEEDKALYAELLRLLLEEERDIVEEYQLYLREHVEITRAMREALLAPTATAHPVMTRQRNSIDRHIERKLRLLLHLQGVRQRKVAAAMPPPPLRGRHQGAQSRDVKMKVQS